MHKIKNIVINPLFFLFAFFAIFPHIFPIVGGYTYLAVEVLIWSIFATGFNIVLGYTGLPSFGHGAIFGIGAYALGNVILHVTEQMWIGLLAAIVAGAIFGGIMGFFVTKKRGIYFSLLTIAFAQMFWFIAWKWRSLTGGEDGIAGIDRQPIELPGLFSINLDITINFYYFVYVIFVLAVITVWIIVHSPFGRVIQAIRYNEKRVSCLGYNIIMYKWVAFVISAAFSGLAGGLYALLRHAAFTEIMHWSQSGNVLLMVILGGGLVSFFGPVVGTIVFLFLRDLISTYTSNWYLIYGLMIMFTVIFIPEGILSYFTNRKKKLLKNKLGEK